jgi:Calcineurin-like phosphoesterase
MHEITGNQDAVLKILNDTVNQLGQDRPKSKAFAMESVSAKTETAWSRKRDEFIERLKRSQERLRREKHLQSRESHFEAVAETTEAVPQERAVPAPYAPRDQMLALIQSAMDEYLDEQTPKPKKKAPKKKSKGAKKKGLSFSLESVEAEEEAAPKATLDAFYTGKPGPMKPSFGMTGGLESIGEQFSNLDPRWVEVVWEKAKVLFKGKHKFITHKSATHFRFTMNDNVTIAVVGDWGGGNAAALAVARQINNLNPQPDHVIHLGDVYYAGTVKEVQERFLKYWPTPKAPGMSFALNSNHEMYSGGYGYFDYTLKQFKQPASYFSLANKNWRFIGLDTGYVEHDLNNEQVDWLTAQFKGKNQKTILLSHHQLFSAYENTNASHLQSRVQPFLSASQIYGWIWGHEHLCVSYKPHMGIKAICLGNGCFPYNPPKNQPKVGVAWIDDRQQAGDPEYRGTHTFALITINGPAINIKYIDQDGNVAPYQDNWS